MPAQQQLDAGAGELEDWPVGNQVTPWVRLQAKAWDADALASLDDQVVEGDMASLIELNGRKIRANLIEQGRTIGRLEGGTEERARLRRELSALPLDPEMAARVSQVLDAGERHDDFS